MPKRKDTGPPTPKARPGRWKKKPRPLVDSVWVGEECRRELEIVARAYGASLSEIMRVMVMAHAGNLDVAYEEHREMLES